MSITADQRDAIINILNEDDYLGPNHADRSFRVIEQVPLAVVVGTKNTEAVPETFGSNGNCVLRVTWTFALTCFVKDEGDVNLAYDRLDELLDIIHEAVAAHQTLNDACEKVTAIRSWRTPGQARIVGETAWLPFDVEIDTMAWISA